MTKDEFDSLIEEAREQNGEWSTEWSTDDAVEMSFREAEEIAGAVAEYQKLKKLRGLIEKSHQERSNENDQ